MAILNFCGFETQNDDGGSGANPGTEFFGGGFVTSPVRSGSASFQSNTAAAGSAFGGITLPLIADNPSDTTLNLTTLWCRFYLRFASLPASGTPTVFWCNANFQSGSSNLKSVVKVNSSGNLIIYDSNNSTAVETGTTALTTNQWYKIEYRQTKGSSGTYEVKIDGNVELSGTLDTEQAGTNNIAAFWFGKITGLGSSVALNYYIDDIVIDDSAYPGFQDSQIEIMQADGNGNYTAWNNDYLNVDDVPVGYGASVDTSTNTNRESVTLESASSAGVSGTVHAVLSIGVLERTSAPTTAGAVFLRSGTTDDDLSIGDVNRNSSYGYGKIYTTNPDGGGAWTTSALDSIEIGVLHSQSQTRRLDCWFMGAEVLFTPPSGATFPGWVQSRGGWW